MHAAALSFAIYQMPAPPELKQPGSFYISVLFSLRKQQKSKDEVGGNAAE